MNTKELIESFLKKKRIAFAGVSSSEKDFSRILMNDLLKRGYDVVPVNPNIDEIGGMKSYASVKEIEPPVEAVLIMTKPEAAVNILQDSIEANIPLVWLYRGAGKGSVSNEAMELAKDKNIRLIPGFCPYMFLPDSGLIHKIHGFFMKIAGSYPK
ncbi:MAG: CoA-binding protein [candidate division Zixibacteria bacterium]|nr:CoA-binding protein [candidate division Zixibacteria bacterium]NIR64521.1 CoA-binding protein [candidate division Zixibacteria bacterium]NIS16590.1 CoA-binding protein [candidate division Zixibacteria bacterium]NIS46298.1 CoA-binding protein [candidate division Zixibacteria bacterium]NIT52952.1 CoA-binding protein [candidate division Zixibacteria bacterium]